MDSPVNIICLISNFSPSSKRFITRANEYAVDFIKYISIDDTQVRNIIKNRVRKVPYLIVSYSSGNVEVYESDKSFDWLNEIITNKLRQEIEEKTRQEQLRLKEIEDLKQKQIELEQAKIEQAAKFELQQAKNEEIKTQPSPVSTVGNRFTSISDLGDDVPTSSPDDQQQKMVNAATKKSSSLLERARELEKGREELSNKKQL